MNNKQFYAKSIKEYGVSAAGVHWNNKYTQYRRFEILTKLIKKDIVNSTIIDAGCGFAEYYRYLDVNHKIPIKYIGYDCEDEMLNVAKKRFRQLEFYNKNILVDTLDEVDYYICSGAMNIMPKDDVFLFIKRCFTYSKKGFIFNILKSMSFNEIDIDEVLDYCKSLASNIKTKDNYLDNDFTIFMLK
ncbi:MAG: class I SAM-dependent methyltransferase [Arcobacteraceae bacterium]|nr:class I SAM-dependent methyltransferase [Arcobacteraceae bacterium]